MRVTFSLRENEFSCRYIIVAVVVHVSLWGFFLLPRIPLLFKIPQLKSTWRLIRKVDVELSKISDDSCNIDSRILYCLLAIFLTVFKFDTFFVVLTETINNVHHPSFKS